MTRTFQYLLITIILAIFLGGAVFAGGRGESRETDRPEPAPESRGDRIEFGREVERPEVTEDPDDADDSEEGLGLWIIADHDLDQTLEREISTILQQGYTPVGMERLEDGISMLYIRTEALRYDRWIIHEFTDLSALNEEFSAFLVDGWLPMGFSKHGDSITVFFVRSRETEINAWRIHDVPAGEMEQLFGVVEAYMEEGYLPYGLSIDRTDNRIWLLVLETETSPVAMGRAVNVLINGFAEDEIVDGVTEDVSRGAVPWGMSRGRDASFFLYLF